MAAQEIMCCGFSFNTVDTNPANIYLFKVNNKNTRKRCEICSKSTIKTSNDVGDFVNIRKEVG